MFVTITNQQCPESQSYVFVVILYFCRCYLYNGWWTCQTTRFFHFVGHLRLRWTQSQSQFHSPTFFLSILLVSFLVSEIFEISCLVDKVPVKWLLRALNLEGKSSSFELSSLLSVSIFAVGSFFSSVTSCAGISTLLVAFVDKAKCLVICQFLVLKSWCDGWYFKVVLVKL